MKRQQWLWGGVPKRMLKWLGYGAVAMAAGLFTFGESSSFGQRRERGRGRSNRGDNAQIRVPASGGAQVRVPSAGGEVRVPSSGAEVRAPAATGQVRVPAAGGEVRVPAAGEVRVPGAGGTVRVPGAGAEIRAPGARADVRVPSADGQIRVPAAGGEVRVPSAGADVRLPNTDAQIRVPGAGGEIRAPGAGADVRLPNTDAQIRVPGAGGEIRAPGAGADVRVPSTDGQIRVPAAGGEVRVPGASADVRVPSADAQIRVPGASGDVRVPGVEGRTALRPNVDADVRGGVQLDGSASARVPGGVRIDPSVRTQGNVRFAPNWANMSRDGRRQFDDFRASLNNAMRAEFRDRGDRPDRSDRVFDGNDWFQRNPDRAGYWSRWGNNARSSFNYGGDPFFNYNWWNTRSLIGIGLGRYGYASGPGYGGWWGYQPWLGYRPWSYWYGRPGWSSLIGFFPGWGWSQPYYYDYGPGGNVVYTGSQVVVNSQPVGTPVQYAQSAAELSVVDPATVGQTKPEDWMALGTFTLATAQDERDPARVLQLAVNKEGLISGTSFNKQTGKTYTVQGRVDKDTQRVAFTIGNATDLVMETGLFNLTQEETPLLAHLGPNKTTTYLLARLPEPKHEEEAVPHTAAVPSLP